MIKHVTEENFEEVVGKGRILVDFYATWCGPCKMLGMTLENYDKKGVIDIVKIDVDGAPNLSNKFKIFSVPTLVIFENGSEVKRISGFMTEEELNKWVSEQ
ncbi:MAG: thioredoxin [Bacilli bacterium]|nr:thioredoxin [Bacilli bacterium]